MIANYCEHHGAEIDEILAGLRPIEEPLSVQDMATIVSVHGRLTELLVGVTSDGKAPRSFAAKYLHFYRPLVPIYDSYAAVRLGALVPWDAKHIPFEQPPGGDGEYWSFCVRFFRLYGTCVKAGLDVKVKGLDTYLWQVPQATPDPAGDVGANVPTGDRVQQA